MSKQEKITHHGNLARVTHFQPSRPLYGENIITCKKTDADGNPINVSPVNAALSREQPDTDK